jgi:hypothetical protein
MPLVPDLSFGRSAIMASVVISNDATEAASWSATRTTLAGSMMPPRFGHGDHVAVFFGLGVEAVVAGLFQQLADNDGAFDASVFGDLADLRFQRARHDV